MLALGGSSRPDAIQIAALRPLVALSLIPALYYMSPGALSKERGLLSLMALFAAWMALQLVPLPPSLWMALPGRSQIAELDAMAGLDGLWRPISMSPTRGWNALASLIVPVSGVLLAVALRVSARNLLFFVAIFGIADAAMGILQVISGNDSAFYLYAITNRGSAVGIFANENHSAVFSALQLIVLARLAIEPRAAGGHRWLRYAIPIAFLLSLIAILISGSRAGLAMGVFAILVATTVAWYSLGGEGRKNARRKSGRFANLRSPRFILAVFILLVIGLLGVFLSLERIAGLNDALNQNAFEDLRWRIVPVLEQMVGTFWLLGIGFGSFEETYHIFEPTELLLRAYVNQAHNDWAQFLIEGGVPAIALLVALGLWVAVRARRILTGGRRSLATLLLWGGMAAIIMGASIVDYPLRTPIFQLVVMWLLLAFSQDASMPAEEGQSN